MHTAAPLAERVRTLRQTRGLTQHQLAHAVRRSQGFISNIERGLLPTNAIRVARALAKALRVDPHELLEG